MPVATEITRERSAAGRSVVSKVREPGSVGLSVDTPRVEPATDDRRADRQLVERLRLGDEAAFTEIVDRWSPAMVRVARGYIGTTHSAEATILVMHSRVLPLALTMGAVFL